MIVRQGDVLVMRATMPSGLEVEAVPPDAGRVVLAYGEATGHAHVLPADAATLWKVAGKTARRVLRVAKRCELRHEEHAPIALEPGEYWVVRQREYEPEAVRFVAD